MITTFETKRNVRQETEAWISWLRTLDPDVSITADPRSGAVTCTRKDGSGLRVDSIYNHSPIEVYAALRRLDEWKPR
jgi:hypothetical protein